MRLIDVLHDERGFVHKKLLGLVSKVIPLATGLIPGGSIVRQAIQTGTRFFTSRFRPPPVAPTAVRHFAPANVPMAITTPRPTVPREITARVTPMSQAQKQFGLTTKFGNGIIPDISNIIREKLGFGNGNGNGNGQCDDPRLIFDPVTGICKFPGSPAGGMGEAVMGQFGAALEPFFFTINQRRCLPGMVLGKDKLCYNSGAISNKERLWPKGAAPLLTGGEMSAIRKAATAAGKFQRAGKRLAAVGKTFSGPSSRRAPQRRLSAGKTVKVLESGPGSVQL